MQPGRIHDVAGLPPDPTLRPLDALTGERDVEVPRIHPNSGNPPPYGQRSPQAQAILRAEPIRCGVTTHSVDNSQRLVEESELAGLLAAGTRPADIGQRGDERWHVLADPEGSEFCLLRTPLPAQALQYP